MSLWARFSDETTDEKAAMVELLRTLMDQGVVEAALCQAETANGGLPVPVLFSDPEELSRAAPLSRVFPVNAARMVSRLTARPGQGRIAAVLRPCEVRAHLELVKLNQSSGEDVLCVSFDCRGAVENGAAGTPESVGTDMAQACTACTRPVGDMADLCVATLGVEGGGMLISANTEAGQRAMETLGLAGATEPPGRKRAVDEVLAEKREARDAMLAKTADAAGSLEKLADWLSRCVACGNCRVACPVCYCRECVFQTSALSHEPVQYLKWARRRGSLRMPADTLFYHLTRMAHMSLSCVGCGQCANMCPNGVGVFELMALAADTAQQAFSYEPGMDLSTGPPLGEWKESEFEEIVGMQGV
ncbi:MAG: 4Fe-4S dicluster domain-containing protein [Desulfatibacillaceae bacterium]